MQPICSDGVGDLIPKEAVEVKKNIQHICSDGVGYLIP
jgi:hypothetical protein